jgi:hypothetical protein
MNSLVRTGVLGPELVTLAAMKNWLRVPVSTVNDDADITDLIQEARIQAELITNCALVRSTFVQYLDHFPGWGDREYGYFSPSGASGGTGGGTGAGGMGYNRHNRHYGEIKLKRPPCVSVQSLVYIGTDGRPYTLNPGQDFIVDVAAQPARIRPIPYTIWPLTLHVPAAIAIAFTAGYSNNTDAATGGSSETEPETVSEADNPSWVPSAIWQQYQFLIDGNGNVEVQQNAGPVASGAGPAPPVWAAIGFAVADGAASWLNCGPIRGFWTPDTKYVGPYVVLDFNSNLQLLNVTPLTSQTIGPVTLQIVGVAPIPWASTLGALTADNGIANAWRCIGPYVALGNTGLSIPNSPEQQAAFTIDFTLPRTVTRAVKALVTHWYYNREPFVAGSVSKVPQHVEDLLGGVTVHDFAPTP